MSDYDYDFCTAMLKEPRRNSTKTDSWRCSLPKGHTPVDKHRSIPGHRTWQGGPGVTWNAKERSLPAPEPE